MVSGLGICRVVEGGCVGEVVGRLLGEGERGRRPNTVPRLTSLSKLV